MNLDWEQALNEYQSVIASGTKRMQIKAIKMLAQFSKRAPEDVLASSIPTLTGILGREPSNDLDRSLQKAAAYCLKCIASRGDGGLAKEISRHDGAHCLVKLLPHSDGKFQEVLIKCLAIIVSFCDESRAIVDEDEGLEIIIRLLNSRTDDVRGYLLEILSALAMLREVRRDMTRLGALRYLVEALSCGSMVSRERACQAIGFLGVARRARRMLVELGVIPKLVELFRYGDGTTKLVAGNTIGVISAHANYIRPVAQAGAIPLYAELLQGPGPSGKEIAEDAFCILAVAEDNAVEIAGYLTRILREGDDEAKAAAADVIWDLSGYKHSIPVIRDSGAIPILVELLGSGSQEVKENVSGAIAQLSYDGADRMELAEAGAIPLLTHMLHDESEELKNNVAEAIVNFSEDPLYRDRVSDVVNDLSFRNMQSILNHVRASNEHMSRSLRRMSIEQFTSNPSIV
ncbi:hypothetical protein L6164_031029 [Bauhinia variegata]|uniref:Uncharacterized protein n=1 Tax=Bauhinia variegata TaxID=167791 RepID=A0ACB9LEN5_BAUVA|nr:hypothetical protein L6164_031029 [Bauhinia variegata]